MIKIEQLIRGKAYQGEGRNFDIGIYDGKTFWGLRHKFRDYFMDCEEHWDDNGTFKPFKELT